MADIIDAFCVTLGLDATQYNRQIREFRDTQKRLREQETKDTRAQEDGQKRLLSGMKELRNETAGFLFMLAGANGIKDFVSNIVSGDAATGRLAANMGVATQNLAAWQAALGQVGGTAADATQALQTLTTLYQNYQLGVPNQQQLAGMQGLGITDISDPEKVLMKMAAASQRMSRPEFTARMSMIGINQNMTTLLAQGPDKVGGILEEMRKIGVATDADAEAAQRFEASLGKISQSFKAEFRPAVENAANAVGEWLSKSENMNLVMTTGVGLMAALAISVAAAYAPVIALAGAIVVLTQAFSALAPYWEKFDAKWEQIKQDTDPVFDPVRKALGMKSGAEMRAEQATGVSPLATWDNDEQVGGVFGARPTGGASGMAGAGAIRSGGGDAARAQRYFQSQGFSAQDARGMVAAMRAENGSLDPSAFNSAGGGQGAYGLGQWRGPRLRALRARYGQNPTFDQQMAFMVDEMKNGDAGGGAATAGAMRGAGAAGAARGMINRFYRPGNGAQGDYDRAGRVLGINLGNARGGASMVRQTTTVGTIVVHTAATDANGIARDMRGAMAKRGLVVQANPGLQ